MLEILLIERLKQVNTRISQLSNSRIGLIGNIPNYQVKSFLKSIQDNGVIRDKRINEMIDLEHEKALITELLTHYKHPF